LSRKKGAAVAIIAVVAVIGGLVAYSAMPRQQEPGPAPVLTTIDRDGEPEGNERTTIAEVEEESQNGDSGAISNNTVIANNTIIINKPVYRNNTIIYQPVTINLENYKTTINQYSERDDDDSPVETTHSLTVRAERIESDGWSPRFTDDGVGMFTAVYDINGELVDTGYADERGFTVEGLENTIYFIFPADCTDCPGSNGDIMFRHWEDGSRDRPRLVPAGSDVTARYGLVLPERQQQVPLTPPQDEEALTEEEENPPEQAPPEEEVSPEETETPPTNETETAAEPELTIQAQNATFVYGWVQVIVQVENMVEGFDEIMVSVYAPDGTLHDSFPYPEQQGFFASRDMGEGKYRINASYDYGNATVGAEIEHPVSFATPEFKNLSVVEDDDGVRLNGLLEGGLAGENVTIAVHDPEGDQIREYGLSFGTRPIFTLLISNEDSGAIFNQTGNYTFAVTHVQTGVQANETLSVDAGNETETAATPINVSDNQGRSARAAVAADGSDVYLVWEDDASGQNEILFARSEDAGETFSGPVAISRLEDDGFARNPDITVSGDSVYVVWADYDVDEESTAAFVMSNDSGESFGNKTVLGDYLGEGADPRVAVFGGDVYVSWIAGAEEEFTGNLMLGRSSNGIDFEAAPVAEEVDGLLMTSSDQSLYLSWLHYPTGDTSSPEGSVNTFARSDNGVDFETTEYLEGAAVTSLAASGSEAYAAGFANETVVIAKSSSDFNATEISDGTRASVAASGDTVYLVWEQGDVVLFAASSDGGATFGEAASLSGEGNSFWPEIALDENAFVTWTEGTNDSSDIMFSVQ
jgi:hypothetical protein